MNENRSACLDCDLELMRWPDRFGVHQACVGEHHPGGQELIGSGETWSTAARTSLQKREAEQNADRWHGRGTAAKHGNYRRLEEPVAGFTATTRGAGRSSSSTVRWIEYEVSP